MLGDDIMTGTKKSLTAEILEGADSHRVFTTLSLEMLPTAYLASREGPPGALVTHYVG